MCQTSSVRQVVPPEWWLIFLVCLALEADYVKEHASGSGPVRSHSSLPTVMVFFRRLIVARTVAAVPVERAQQPPAMVFLQVLDLHFLGATKQGETYVLVYHFPHFPLYTCMPSCLRQWSATNS